MSICLSSASQGQKKIWPGSNIAGPGAVLSFELDPSTMLRTRFLVMEFLSSGSVVDQNNIQYQISNLKSSRPLAGVSDNPA